MMAHLQRGLQYIYEATLTDQASPNQHSITMGQKVA